jgi:hypothetical protein
MAVVAVVLGVAALAGRGRQAEATVDMENQARKLGFKVDNCLYCHASPHATEVMKERAKKFGVNPGNCLGCHGKEIPATLNDRGQWLVKEKKRRGAAEFDMAWLKDYKEPEPAKAGAAAPAAPPSSHPPTLP